MLVNIISDPHHCHARVFAFAFALAVALAPGCNLGTMRVRMGDAVDTPTPIPSQGVRYCQY